MDDFNEGVISVRFKAISGRIDQAAGIAFNIKPNGDYLIVRANPLENNLVAFKMRKAHCSDVQWIRNVPTLSNRWRLLKVVVKGNIIEGYLNNKRYINFKYGSGISGKIGFWSKADSYVIFDYFAVYFK